MFRIIYILFILSILLSSCVTNKDIDLFSIKNNTKIKVSNSSAKLSDGDLLYVEIKSLTPNDYDFFNKSQDNSVSRLNNPYIYGYLVNDSGYISLPMLGEIFVRGSSIDDAEKLIKNIASDYFTSPFVKLVVLNFNVTVLGEVKNPGLINIFEPTINLLDVIGKANGFTQIANRKKIKIIRLEGEKPEIFYVDLTDKKLANSKKFFVKSGDVINIEPIEKRFFVVNNISTALSTIISSLTLYFLLTNE
tara:strand:- start:760 stop:1503 length:744 start_codon:yes stop_codon:yes gene_type:complete